MKKKIFWVTSDCFVDVDFNIEILSQILKKYTIDWYILLPSENAIYSDFDFSSLEILEGLKIYKLHSNYNTGDFRKIELYIKLLKALNKTKPSLIYINCAPSPYIVFITLFLNRFKTIIATHEGDVHKGFNNRFLRKLMRLVMFNRIKYVNLFSNSEGSIFIKKNPSKKVFITPLSLKSFGNFDTNKENDVVVFLVFGHICYEKNIELLINAANNIFLKGYRKFKIVIKGKSLNWDYYNKQIIYPEIFECDIRLIDNLEIPKLFCSSHFLVQPYRIVSQSGPLKIAFNYNLPVICSDLPGFTDEVIDGINGFIFESNNIKALEEVLIKCINLNKEDYLNLTTNMKIHTNLNYSSLSLSEKYISMFDSIIN